MIDFLKENKLMAGIVALALAGSVAYFGFFAKSDSGALLSSQATPETTAVSRELLSTLSDLKRLKLDNSLFTDPAFLSLVDFRVDIPLQPVGRDNPFAPLGSTPRVGTSTIQN